MRDRIFVVDGYAGWDPKYRVNVRVLCSRAYHALFMKNMLVRRLPLACGTPAEPPRKRAHARHACCRSRSLQPTWTRSCRTWSSSTPAASRPTGTWTASPPRARSTCTWAATRSASTGRRWERPSRSPRPAPRALAESQAPANIRSAGVCSRSRRRRWSSWARSTRAR